MLFWILNANNYNFHNIHRLVFVFIILMMFILFLYSQWWLAPKSKEKFVLSLRSFIGVNSSKIPLLRIIITESFKQIYIIRLSTLLIWFQEQMLKFWNSSALFLHLLWCLNNHKSEIQTDVLERTISSVSMY